MQPLTSERLKVSLLLRDLNDIAGHIPHVHICTDNFRTSPVQVRVDGTGLSHLEVDLDRQACLPLKIAHFLPLRPILRAEEQPVDYVHRRRRIRAGVFVVDVEFDDGGVSRPFKAKRAYSGPRTRAGYAGGFMASTLAGSNYQRLRPPMSRAFTGFIAAVLARCRSDKWSLRGAGIV